MMTSYNTYLSSNTKTAIDDSCNQLLAETRVYKNLSNPCWKVKRKFANRLFKLSLGLPVYSGPFPVFDDGKPSGSSLSDSNRTLIWANDDFVVLYTGNIIMVRMDSNRIIENEIIRSAPDEIYKEIYHYL